MSSRSALGTPDGGDGTTRTRAARWRLVAGSNGRWAGRTVELPGRGSVFVKRIAGPRGAATVILLHGWTATADLNWRASYRALAQHFHVVAFDHHGHGRGVRAQQQFELEHCADDVAAVAAALGLDRVIVAGYSMGGPIASLVWRRHRQLVDGLVLCATSSHFRDSPTRRAFFTLVSSSANLSGHRHLRALGRLPATAWSKRLQRRGCEASVIEQGLGHDWTRVLEAGAAIGRFDARSWAGTIDAPTAVIATLDDTVVPTQHQFELAEAVPGSSIHHVPGGHTACTDRAGRFTAELITACRSVAERSIVRPSLSASGLVSFAS